MSDVRLKMTGRVGTGWAVALPQERVLPCWGLKMGREVAAFVQGPRIYAKLLEH